MRFHPFALRCVAFRCVALCCIALRWAWLQFLKFVNDVSGVSSGAGSVAVSSKANLLFAQAVAACGKGKGGSRSALPAAVESSGVGLPLQAFLVALRLLARQVHRRARACRSRLHRWRLTRVVRLQSRLLAPAGTRAEMGLLRGSV
jgi:hypothetical protein